MEASHTRHQCRCEDDGGLWYLRCVWWVRWLPWSFELCDTSLWRILWFLWHGDTSLVPDANLWYHVWWLRRLWHDDASIFPDAGLWYTSVWNALWRHGIWGRASQVKIDLRWQFFKGNVSSRRCIWGCVWTWLWCWWNALRWRGIWTASQVEGYLR